MTDHATEEKVRIDKWLWAARFFKTRSLASQAVTGGLVHVNGQRTKPSRQLEGGELLRITRGLEVFAVKVVGLASRRGPAARARMLYEETDESVRARESVREEHRVMKSGPGMIFSGRPNKRERRQIRRFVRGDDQE